jgi:streptomycin 6-kinase
VGSRVYREWIDEFPDLEPMRRIASEVAAEWELQLGEPFALSRYSYVAPAGNGVVLKVAWHGDDESLHEAQSLELWNGNGAVRLLRSDPARRALLEERAVPGDDISGLPEDR